MGCSRGLKSSGSQVRCFIQADKPSSEPKVGKCKVDDSSSSKKGGYFPFRAEWPAQCYQRRFIGPYDVNEDWPWTVGRNTMRRSCGARVKVRSCLAQGITPTVSCIAAGRAICPVCTIDCRFHKQRPHA